MTLAIEETGTWRDEILRGRSGDDMLDGAGGADTLLGNAGNDQLYSGLKHDDATGTWMVDDKGDVLDGGEGDDILQGGAGDDRLLGGSGADELYGGGGRDSLEGGEGDDILQSGKPYDPATDSFVPDMVGDWLNGGAGDDELYGEDGADIMNGGPGHDYLTGAGGADLLVGGDGDDLLAGDDGNDTLSGGSGSNLLIGGLGDDSYIIRSELDVIWEDGGNDSGVIHVDWFVPLGSVENWRWAPGVQQLPNWIAALAVEPPQARVSGEAKVVNYHFAERPAANFLDEDKVGFEPFNQAQRAFARQVFDYVSTVANVEFRETSELDGEDVVVMANNLQTRTGGYANTSILMLNHQIAENLAPSVDNLGVLIFMHELGHVLGLKHPFGGADAGGSLGEGPVLSSDEDAAHHTLMSYHRQASDIHLHYNALDLAALQYMYGPARQLAAGDTTWVLDAAKANFIADGGGRDLVDGSAFADGITVDLRPGYWGFLGAKADSIVKAGQVTVNFGSVIEDLRGGAGNDTLTGNEIGNRIDGGAGNDLITGGLGGDLLDGGLGLDVAVYAGKRADYKLTTGKDGSTVAALDLPLEIDSLTGIERVKFDDAMLAFDTDGVAGQAYRLYQAAFDRTPDMAGLGYWIGRMDAGTSLDDVAAAFIGSQVFAQVYGAKPSNADFLGKVYQNTLHRAPDPAGFDYWLMAMDLGTDTAAILTQFSESQENVAALAGVLGGGIAYTPFG